MKKSILLIAVGIFIMSVTLSSAIAAEKISPLTATASSWRYRYYPSNAVDGDYNTFWSGGRASPLWIMFDTGAVHDIAHINIKWYSSSSNYMPTDYDIQISSDGSSWEEVFTGIGGIYDPSGKVRDINRAARYIRLYINEVGFTPVIREFEAYKSDAPVNQLPIAQASANPTSGYAPLTVQFTGSGSDSDGTIVSYHWTFGDGGTSNQQNPSHTYQNPGTYGAILTVTDNDGATDTDSVTITVIELANQPPTAQITADKTSGDAPLNVQFTGDGSSDPDGIIVSYQWVFGDGGTSTQQNPSHTYQNAGTYTATLAVTDDDGASDAASVTITSGVEIPHLIRFQGNLADAEGLPLTDTFTLTFAIYDVETGDTSLWEEVHADIDIEKGFLDVKLGSVTALDLPFDKQYWLGVQVESDSEMTPRFELTTVPYSFRSEN